MVTLTQDDINEMQIMLQDFRYADAMKLIAFINRKIAAQPSVKQSETEETAKTNGANAVP